MSDNSDPHPDWAFRSEEDLSQVLSQDDPDRMVLTQTENEHALAIKQRIESLRDLDNLSDFMYAQLAIVCKDNMEDILERCYAMQTFREEYEITDTFQEGCRFLQHMFDLFPEEWLSFNFSEKDGTYVLIHDPSKFDAKAFTTLAAKNNWMRGMYYFHNLFFPDFESVRKGIICVVECKDVQVTKSHTASFSQFFSEFLTYYPFNGCCHLYHTGTLVNIMASILRKILPEELRKSFQVGFQFEGHLAEAFLVPTVQEANQRMFAALKQAMNLRFEHEKYFVLRESQATD